MSSDRPKLAIIGGGASGLTLAWLVRDEFDVVVFERGQEVGGNWSTIELDGRVIEMGAVKVFEHNQYLRRLCELMGTKLTLDDVVPGGQTSLDDTFRIHYPHIRSKVARGALIGAAFAYLGSYFAIYHALEAARRFDHERVAAVQLRHVEAMTGLAMAPRTLRETVRAFLWMGALTYEDIEQSAFIGLMANVHNNFAGFGKWRIFNIDTGFQSVARKLREVSSNVRFECDAPVDRVEDAQDKLQVRWTRGGETTSEDFDHVVFACPPWRAAEILHVRGCERVRERLDEFVNAPDRVVLHDDEAIVGKSGIVQLTVDAQAFYANLRTGVRNLWKSYMSYPTPAKYAHPRPSTIEHEEVFDTDAFRAAAQVPDMNSDAVQGVKNTWYIHNAYHPSFVRNGEQAVEQAIGICERLCPQSSYLLTLKVPPAPLPRKQA